jgi:uncharacterized membrane protein YecN with MAPEG domain
MKFRISATYVAIAMLMLVPLSINVVKERNSASQILGAEPNTSLHRAVRAHGNFAEYAPIILIGLVVLESLSASKKTLHAMGSLFIFGRASHAVSILYLEPLHQMLHLRKIGMITTFSIMLAIAIAIFAHARKCKD